MTSPKVSIVVPIYNEESCLPELIRRLAVIREQSIGNLDFEAILVDDGSTDSSREMLLSFARDFDWITSRLLTRNFGHQIAVTAGMDIAAADFVAIIDGDLQDPPELIPEMIQQLVRNNDQIVYGQRISREGEGVFKLSTARLFYGLIRRSSRLDIPLDTGDFRVMTRHARDTLCNMREHNRFLRGMAPWTGLKSSSFSYSRDMRFAGTTKYTMGKMFNFAFNAIVSFSTTPIRAMQGFGVLVAVMGLLGVGISGATKLVSDYPTGIAFLASLNALTMGVVVASVGVVGGYVHRIQDEVRGRPLYLVEES
jgi:glycosyltransferase involved in cell wall biosynthesis